MTAAPDRTTIEIAKNGPYLVNGPCRLRDSRGAESGGCGKEYRYRRRYTSGLRQAPASHGCIARGRPGGR
jgi:hypothetical protein